MAYSDLIPKDLQEFLYNPSVSLNKSLKRISQIYRYISLGSLPMIEDFLSDRLDICILALPEDNEFPKL